MTLRASKITFGVTVASAVGVAIGLLVSILTGASPAQAGQIFQRNTGNNAWNPIGGCATDVGVGANGAVWVIGCDPVVGGYGIHNWQGPGGAKHIAVRPNGLPVVVNNDGVIFTGDGKGTWNALPGCARDVGVGANDRIWIVGCNAVPGGYTPYYWNGYWQNIPGGITRISVKPNGAPVATNSDDAIFDWNGSFWQALDGRAKDISAGADGSLWVIGNDQQHGGYGIHKRVGSTWQPVDGGATKIAVDPQGKPWLADA